LKVVWAAGKDGAPAPEIWRAVSERRPVARTTVLTQIQRLQRRGWLIRTSAARGSRYRVARDLPHTLGGIAARLMDEFFGGSATQLVMGILGARRIDAEELRQLRSVLDEAERKAPRAGGSSG
jgi:predicted transcriptional regulator